MGIFDASNESYLREEDVEDPELDEGEFRSFYVIVKNNNLDDRRDVPVWFRVDGGIEQPMNELEHYSRSPYIVHYPNFGETKGLILSPNRNSKIFPAEFVPYCVAFLDQYLHYALRKAPCLAQILLGNLRQHRTIRLRHLLENLCPDFVTFS